MHDAETASRVMAERAMNRRLEGGCQVPIACYATLNEAGDELYLRGLVASTDGTKILRDELRNSPDQAEQMGIELAERLLAAGADSILAEVYKQNN